MKTASIWVVLGVTLACLGAGGCRRSGGEVWEDTKTCGHYMGRGMRSLGGKHGDSRQCTSRDQFGLCGGDEFAPADCDRSCGLAMGDREGIPQSQLSPGDASSGIPGIDGFKDPGQDPELSSIFRHIHFDYDSPTIKGQDNLAIVKGIADYMKAHPNTYVFVEGHCDERGPQSYNFALGTQRSNAIRNLLIKDGVDLNNVFTISYGKERPLIVGNGEQSWFQNRRGQFKVYTR